MAPNEKMKDGIKLDDFKEEITKPEVKIEKVVHILPDGGYGWVVVIASFLTHLIVDGMIYSYGMFFRELLNEFECGTGYVAGLGSLLSGTCLLSAPLAAALVNMYGCRRVVMAGSFISFLGFFIASFSPSISFMMPFFGILGGIGYGMMFLPMVVMVSYYFDKKRAIATGIAVSGSGMGMFLFAPLCRWLLEIYDWRNALVILSCINMQGMVLGALLKPVSHCKEEVEEEVGSVHEEEEYLGLKFKAESQLTVHMNGEIDSNSLNDKAIIELDLFSNEALESETMDPIFISLKRKDIFYSGSVLNIPEYLKHANLNDYTRSITSIPKKLSVATINAKLYLCHCIPVSVLFKNTLAQMTDISLLKEPMFAVVCVANFLGAMGLFIPFVYLTDRAISLNIPPNQAVFLLSVIGICNTIGRFLCGAVATIRWVNPLLLHNLSLVAAGVVSIVSTLFRTYHTLCIFSVIYGFCIAFFVSITSTLLCNMLGLEKLTNAYGIVVMVRGVATLLGTPLTGIFFDFFQSFEVTFYIGGALILGGGLVGLMLNCSPRSFR